MAVESAGLILYRRRSPALELLIAHMGGPLWARREERAWTIVKGELEKGEEPLAAARREFAEETGAPPPEGAPIPLGEVRQASGKRVHAWALQGDFEESALRSQTFSMEWPPRSGRRAEFPEIDRVRWCDPQTAAKLLIAAQAEFVARLLQTLGESALT